MSTRVEKVNSVIKKDISNIISNELNDPRLANSFVTVSSVNVSADLKYAKIFLSIFSANKETSSEEVLSAIISAGGYIRKQLASKLKLSIGQNYTSCHPNYIIIYRTISSVLAGMSMQPSLFLILI